jgi:hypothetical protein
VGESATALAILGVLGPNRRNLVPLNLGKFYLAEMRFPVGPPNALIPLAVGAEFFGFTPGQVVLLYEVCKDDVAGNVFALGIDFFEGALYQRLDIAPGAVQIVLRGQHNELLLTLALAWPLCVNFVGIIAKVPGGRRFAIRPVGEKACDSDL